MDVIVERGEVEGTVTPPPSKSYTHRAFIASSLSPSAIVLNPLISDDTLATLSCCHKIGAEFVRIGDSISFTGCQEVNGGGYFYCANSGTTLRLFMGILSLSPNRSVLDGDDSLRTRPNLELSSALSRLGARITSPDPEFRAPVSVKGVLRGGDVEIVGRSSQFVSSLLFALPLARFDSVLRVKELKSRPYVEVTVHVLKESGVRVEREGDTFYIPGEQIYKLRSFKVPADFTSASYMLAAGVIAGKVVVVGLYDSKQGDKRIIDIIREMGGRVRWDRDRGVAVAEMSELEGVEVDARDIPDLIPTVAVLASVAKGRTVVYNAEHLRIKEIDRIRGICSNLKAVGVYVEERDDGFVVRGGDVEGGTVDSFGDHRMAMAFSILGLVARRGVRVKRAEVVSVSYPNFYDHLASLGARISFQGTRRRLCIL